MRPLRQHRPGYGIGSLRVEDVVGLTLPNQMPRQPGGVIHLMNGESFAEGLARQITSATSKQADLMASCAKLPHAKQRLALASPPAALKIKL